MLRAQIERLAEQLREQGWLKTFASNCFLGECRSRLTIPPRDLHALDANDQGRAPSWRFMVTEERALVSVIGPTAGSGVRIEHWRYTAAFSRGPGRPCHTVYLNPPGIRDEGRIGDRHVRCDGAQHSIGIVPAGADCCLQVHASAWDVFALCVEPDRYSAFALNAGLPTADINEDLIDKDATMHHLCRALASSSDEPGSSGTLLWEAISQSILTH
jgi:hypothetical protein